MTQISDSTRLGRTLRLTGLIAMTMSFIALVIGLIIVGSAARDFRASIDVTASAVDAFVDTIGLLDNTTVEIGEGINAAADGVSDLSEAASAGSDGLAGVADFLATDLPDDLEAVSQSMPAAIQAASAIDTTLRALSFVGVDYNPDEPFDASLRRVDDALRDLPGDLRRQSASIEELVPAIAGLAGESDRLEISLVEVAHDLSAFGEITDGYLGTLADAQTAIDGTRSSINLNLWLLRALVVALASVGIAVGFGLLRLGIHLGPLPPPQKSVQSAIPRRIT